MQCLRAASSGGPSRALVTTARHSSLRLLPAPFTTTCRPFSQSQRIQSGSGDYESKYDPPTGWLWGVKPGEQYEKEGWENVIFWGFGGAAVFGTIAYAFKPDTSIQTWALEEARRRLEKEGILPDPDDEKKN